MDMGSAFSHIQLVPLYVGPDQIMPLTSLLGAITGILLIFWQKILAVFHSIGGLLKRDRKGAAGATAEMDGAEAGLLEREEAAERVSRDPAV